MALYNENSLELALTDSIIKGSEKRKINLLNLFVDTGLIIACIYLFFSGQDIPSLMTGIVFSSHIGWQLSDLNVAKQIKKTHIDLRRN